MQALAYIILYSHIAFLSSAQLQCPYKLHFWKTGLVSTTAPPHNQFGGSGYINLLQMWSIKSSSSSKCQHYANHKHGLILRFMFQLIESIPCIKHKQDEVQALKVYMFLLFLSSFTNATKYWHSVF